MKEFIKSFIKGYAIAYVISMVIGFVYMGLCALIMKKIIGSGLDDEIIEFKEYQEVE